MNYMALSWFCLFVVCLITEASTDVLISIWFAAGALVAMIASLLGGELWLQAVLFLTVSVALLLALRPLFRKFIKPRLVRTNVDAVIGMEGLVTQRIDNINAAGQVKVGAMYWSARASGNEIIEIGTQIKVDRIEGVKVFVSPVEVPVQTP